METKICCNCKEEKELTEFNKNKSRKDGHNTICRLCSNARSKRYYEENKEHHREVIGERNKKLREQNRRLLFEYYQSNPCVDCGNDNPIVLELDHRDGTDKVSDVSKMMHSSWETIEAEIKKCDVRCANCHRIRTAKQQGWYTGLIYEGS